VRFTGAVVGAVVGACAVTVATSANSIATTIVVVATTIVKTPRQSKFLQPNSSRNDDCVKAQV
jgi:hypothetical protein